MKVIDIRQIIPKHKTRIAQTRPKRPSHIVVHCTDSENQDPMKTAKYHVTPSKDNHISKLGAPTISYSDFINKEGIVYHCVDYDKITFHAQLYNSRSIGIVMAYKANKGPTSVQYDSLIKHLTVLSLYLKIKPINIIGHREVPGMYTILGDGSKRLKKTCPGMLVNLDDMRYQTTISIQKRLAAEDLYHGFIDGIFGRQSDAAFSLFNPLRNKNNV